MRYNFYQSSKAVITIPLALLSQATPADSTFPRTPSRGGVPCTLTLGNDVMNGDRQAFSASLPHPLPVLSGREGGRLQ